MIAVKAGDSEARADGFLAMLPHIWGRHESRPDDLIGATIVRFGTAPGMEEVEGGGLVIDYKPVGSDEAKRIVFGFNDEGMWVESEE